MFGAAKEQHEIKKNQPRLNHALKYRYFPMGIRRDESFPTNVC